MQKRKKPERWVPEIMYEETGDDDGLTGHIPFISVPKNEEMPKMLFIFETRDTGETEPGPQGEELPVTEMDLHQYADMNFLKTTLDLDTYDKVRLALGLEPLRVAAAKGRTVTDKVRKNLESN